MRTRFMGLCAVIALLLCAAIVKPSSVHAYAGSGSGTANDPYIVTTCEELQSMNDNTTATYILANDIDCAATTTWDGGAGWTPIGPFASKFSGTLDGAGHAVSNIYMSRVATSAFGIFAYVQNATIKNIAIYGSITDESQNGLCMGGLAGYSMDTLTVESLTMNLTISANDQTNVAGLAGCASSSGGAIQVSNSSFDSTITGSISSGLFSEAHLTDGATLTITNSHTGGSLTCESTCAGFVAYITEEWDGIHPRHALTVSDSSSTTIITTNNGVTGGLFGNLVGNGLDATITNSYFEGSITSTAGAASGGLIGLLSSNGHTPNITISKSYARGTISTSGDNNGGLVGSSESALNTIIDQSFADITINGVGDYFGGLIGKAASATISDSYAHATLSGTGHVGGLVGDATTITISRAYATGSISSTNLSLGGLVGTISTATIEDVFAAVSIASSQPLTVGGLIGGLGTGSVTNAYVDGAINSQGCVIVSGNLDTPPTVDCTVVNQANYFANNSQNAPLNEWSFGSVWATAPDKPCLYWYSLCDNGDSDNDGTSNAQEAAAPNQGDANADGTLDIFQPNVASFVNPVTGHYQVIESDCTRVSAIQVGTESSESTDAGYTYPMGLSSFWLHCPNDGMTAHITQLFFGIDGNSQYVLRKWDNGTYATVTDFQLTGMLVGSELAFRVTYTATDGGALDEDATQNGIIIDPVGLGFPADETSQEANTSSQLANSGMPLVTLYTASLVLVAGALTLAARHQTN